MSDPSASPGKKRNLPSWMSSRPKQKNDEGGNQKQAHSKEKDSFSKLLEGVVFVLSGFVNPERGVLRSHAMEMGAEFQGDWNSNCTLLVCAFPNTPKFRQVEADCGTIVSKEWILECYDKKQLVDIDSYLMHAGKPWRKQSLASKTIQDQEPSTSKKSQKQVGKGKQVGNAACSKPDPKASPKHGVASSTEQDYFVHSEVKKWAADDFTKTISWLDSQDEKPDPSDIKKIAAEGILTCLQDAIDSLKQDQKIEHISEQWNFVPRVVEELVKLEHSQSESDSLPKKYLYKQAVSCKGIYEKELELLNDSSTNKKKLKTGESKRTGKERNETSTKTADYDSDETIEMTEDDIEKAYNSVASALCKF